MEQGVIDKGRARGARYGVIVVTVKRLQFFFEGVEERGRTTRSAHGVRGPARRFLGNAGVGFRIQHTAPGPPLVFPTVDQVDMSQLLWTIV